MNNRNKNHYMIQHVVMKMISDLIDPLGIANGPLKSNNTNTPYKSLLEYIRIMFSLTKEDYLSPIRSSIAKFLGKAQKNGQQVPEKNLNLM